MVKNTDLIIFDSYLCHSDRTNRLNWFGSAPINRYPLYLSLPIQVRCSHCQKMEVYSDEITLGFITLLKLTAWTNLMANLAPLPWSTTVIE